MVIIGMDLTCYSMDTQAKAAAERLVNIDDIFTLKFSRPTSHFLKVQLNKPLYQSSKCMLKLSVLPQHKLTVNYKLLKPTAQWNVKSKLAVISTSLL